ncbi:MAG: T9SS type A sorting domain-containing protein, partial [Bacteroidota bacterium]
CAFLPAHASHIMGGEITIAHLSGLNYEVSLTVYRDINGVPMASSANIQVVEQGGPYTNNFNFAQTAMIPLPNGVEKYFFVDTITLPNNGSYTLDWSNCCRNAVILNMTSPAAESMYLNSETLIDGSSSSPVFLNDPVTIALLNQPWTYNPLPFDADGDSLAYSLATPLSTSGNPVAGYSLPMGSAPFAINSMTGEITWTPNTMGHYQAAVLVEEYRGGVKIGEIKRDMQIIVVNANNGNRAMFTGTSGWPTNVNGDYEWLLPIASPFNLTVTVQDADGHTVSLSAAGEPFLFSQNAANFALTPNQPQGTAEGVFSWTPDVSQARSQPYVMAFRASEAITGFTLFEDLTVTYRVDGANAIDPAQALPALEVFPNPASDRLSIRYHLDNAQLVQVDLLDLQGRTVRRFVDGAAVAGEHLLVTDVSTVPSGVYFIQFTLEDGSKVTQKAIMK